MMSKTSITDPTPFPTPKPSPTYLSPVPAQTGSGGILPKTATTWGNLLLIGCVLMYLAAVLLLNFHRFSSMNNKAMRNF